MILACDLGVHRVERQIDFARPGNGTVVDEDLHEELRV
jgi:hypothetical protein